MLSQELRGILDYFAKASGLSLLLHDPAAKPPGVRFGLPGFCAGAPNSSKADGLCGLTHALVASQAALSGERFAYVCPYGLLESLIPLGPGGAFVAMGQARCHNPPQGLVRLGPVADLALGVLGEDGEAVAPLEWDVLAKAMFQALPPYDFNAFDNFSTLLQRTLAALFPAGPVSGGGPWDLGAGAPGFGGGVGQGGRKAAGGHPGRISNVFFLLSMANSLANLSILENAGRTNELAVLLAEHLKTIIQGKARGVSSAGEEAASLSRYLAMQKMRYGELLGYSVSIPPGILGLPLPPDSLLPFAERPVCLGLQQGGAALELSVRFREEEGDVVFEVADNLGPPDRAQEGPFPLPFKDTSELKLVEERIENSLGRLSLLCGGRPLGGHPGAGGEGGVCRILIPKNPKGPAKGGRKAKEQRRARHA